MGQYYAAIVIDASRNVTKVEPGTFASFGKLTEHSWVGNPFVNAVYSLIHNRPRKVAWIGDYSQDPYLPAEDTYAKVLPYDEYLALFNIAQGDLSGISRGMFFKDDLGIVDYDTKGFYLVNHDQSVFIDMEAYIQRSTVVEDEVAWCMDPLPLLTACGNGRGGGDYRNESYPCYGDVGTWAFSSVECTETVPAGYTEAIYCFKED